MAFEREQNLVPTTIGDIVLTLIDRANGPDGAEYRISVLDQNGDNYKVMRGNLVPHLDPETITALQNFVAGIRTQAETEILPV